VRRGKRFFTPMGDALFLRVESVGIGMAKRLTVAAFATALAFTSLAAPAQAQSWQCAPFARFFSGVKIFGDAWTWWEQATGKYTKGFSPDSGAVLVFKPQGSMKQGHVAVVSQVLTDRIIQVTHANWSPIAGHRGQVEEDVTVVDVSEKGDWSQVKVWYDPAGDLGRTVYPTYGFIYQAAHAAQGAVASLAGAATSGSDR